MLNRCTLQLFYERRDYVSSNIISNQLQDLNRQLGFNYIIEELNDPKSRYIKANASRSDSKGIIFNFPYAESYSVLMFSNCHVALLFSLPVPTLVRMWGMVAFNEDPDYIIIFDRFRGLLNWQYNYYFFYSADFRLTSIILYTDISSNDISIVCNTCTPPQQIRYPSYRNILFQKLFPIKHSTLPEFSKQYRRLMKNMNQHRIRFNSITTKFWNIPCSLKHCGLETSQTTCPVSELMERLNFTVSKSNQNTVGYASSNGIYSAIQLNEKFAMPGLILRDSWMRYGAEYRKVGYITFALPTELNANALLKIFDVLSFSILIFFGVCSSLIIFMNKKFVFAPVMWTISIFLQQGTNLVIKSGEAKATRVRVSMTYLVIIIWLFNSFFVGSIFSGEFFCLFTSNRLPQLPKNLGELVQAKNIEMLTMSTTAGETDEGVSSLKETVIPQILEGYNHSQEFTQRLSDLKVKVKWFRNLNNFVLARWASSNKPLPINQTISQPSIFVLVDASFVLQEVESCFGVFKKYFIISNDEESFGTVLLPWVTTRSPFGVIFEEHMGYLTASGVYDNWGKNYQRFTFLQEVAAFHKSMENLGVPEKNYTNYFQKAVINRKDLVKEAHGNI
ncbi:hypothetical protein Fcan01_15349 [Folsomia candida]|uniref:Uncharacterized protein n=1 Tax=Folsomia candida TaxID=158441 RepID=A0A226DXJ9_FOLCA|nr:hypothetical protein Fcan01_15349 [Folsomia candida]